MTRLRPRRCVWNPPNRCYGTLTSHDGYEECSNSRCPGFSAAHPRRRLCIDGSTELCSCGICPHPPSRFEFEWASRLASCSVCGLVTNMPANWTGPQDIPWAARKVE